MLHPFVISQGLSRFSLGLLQSLVRYETLDVSGSVTFVSSQFQQNFVRAVLAQLGGLLADAGPLVRMRIFIFSDVVLLALVLGAAAAAAGPLHPASVLTALNLATAVALPLTTPVAKTLTLDVQRSSKEMLSWDLTVEKLVRYAAPVVASSLLLRGGFQVALGVVAICLATATLRKLRLKFRRTPSEAGDSPAETATPTSPSNAFAAACGSGTGGPVVVAARLVREGFALLYREHLRIFVTNTIITNLVIYPFFSVGVPLLLKSSCGKSSSASADWKTGAGIVNIGGILGPFLSQVMLKFLPKQDLKALRTAMILQALICGLMVVATLLSNHWAQVAAYFALLALGTAATNTFTISLNAFAQENLKSMQRGRFLANLMTLANLANAVGIFAYARSDEADVATFAAVALGAAAAARVILVNLSAPAKRQKWSNF